MQSSIPVKVAALFITLSATAACAPTTFNEGSSSTIAESVKSIPPDYDDIGPRPGNTNPTPTPTPAPSGPNLTEEENVPTVCSPGSVCFAGQRLDFKNDIGNPVTVSIASYSSNSFTASFKTIAQRTVAFSFTLVGNKLVTSTASGMRPQFCYRHDADPCLIMPTPVGNDQYNCHSGLHWSGAFSGDTRSMKVICPGQG